MSAVDSYANQTYQTVSAGITNDVVRGNDVTGGGNVAMPGGNDLIMEENEVYESGSAIKEAKQTEDVTKGYDADVEEIIIEENDAYEGTGHTSKNDDEVIFEENDAYEGTGHTSKNDDEVIFEENDTYESSPTVKYTK